MAKNSVRITSCLVMALMFCAGVIAQDRGLASVAGDRYVISARAGAVNFAEGSVEVNRGGRNSAVRVGEEIEVGERLSTGANGRAEILLNPGSYMRVGANSSLELATTALDDLRIKMYGGSAMFEVFASDKFRVSIIAPKGRLTLIESGIYRVDVAANGMATVNVWDGLAELGDGPRTEVKKSRSGTIGTGTSIVVKFDRHNKDELVTWSKTRGKELAKATQAIKDRAMRGALINSFNGGRWGFYNSFGLWVRDASFGRYCFLPFGAGWYSPYGYGYGNSIWWYNLPPVIYQVQPTAPQNGIKTRTRTDGLEETARISRRPPFMQMETERVVNQPIHQLPDYTRDRTPSAPAAPVPVYVPAPIYDPVPSQTGSKPR